MDEIVAKIKALFARWHDHLDPEAALRGYFVEFTDVVHKEITALKKGVGADVDEYVHNEVAKIERAVGGFLEEMKAKFDSVIDSVADHGKRLALLEQKPETPAPADAPSLASEAGNPSAADPASKPEHNE